LGVIRKGYSHFFNEAKPGTYFAIMKRNLYRTLGISPNAAFSDPLFGIPIEVFLESF
jgi:hypothetical protein